MQSVCQSTRLVKSSADFFIEKIDNLIIKILLFYDVMYMLYFIALNSIEVFLT